MRCKVRIQKITSNPVPYDYQYGLASMLYKRLANSNIRLANNLHGHQGFKFYTFSNLVIEDRIPDEHGLNFTRAYFIISSPDLEFIQSFTEGLLMKPDFFLGRDNRVNFIINSIEILPPREFSDRCTFTTLSPLYVKTLRKKDEKLVKIDLYPKDAKFYENLHTNLTSRYEEFHGYKIDNDFFDIIDVKNFKAKRVTIDNSYRRCSLLSLTLEANPDLIKFAYDAGLGEKNAMGFGCIEVLE